MQELCTRCLGKVVELQHLGRRRLKRGNIGNREARGDDAKSWIIER
jgi:hypothetical protein